MNVYERSTGTAQRHIHLHKSSDINQSKYIRPAPKQKIPPVARAQIFTPLANTPPPPTTTTTTTRTTTTTKKTCRIEPGLGSGGSRRGLLLDDFFSCFVLDHLLADEHAVIPVLNMNEKYSTLYVCTSLLGNTLQCSQIYVYEGMSQSIQNGFLDKC